MQLIRDIHHDQRRQKIVGSMFQLCKSSNMGVIAEGVETKNQLEFLIKQDCDQVQGYFFSPPVSLDVFLKMLGTNQLQSG